MRFITELHLNHPYTPIREAQSKLEAKQDFGVMIGNSFGWQEKANAPFTEYTLEIEAFPMDNWVEFKKKLLAEIITCKEIDEPISGAFVLKLIKELESFSKPAGEAKELK